MFNKFTTHNETFEVFMVKNCGNFLVISNSEKYGPIETFQRVRISIILYCDVIQF